MHDPQGLILIGDAAHAVTPVGGQVCLFLSSHAGACTAHSPLSKHATELRWLASSDVGKQSPTWALHMAHGTCPACSWHGCKQTPPCALLSGAILMCCVSFCTRLHDANAIIDELKFDHRVAIPHWRTARSWTKSWKAAVCHLTTPGWAMHRPLPLMSAGPYCMHCSNRQNRFEHTTDLYLSIWYSAYGRGLQCRQHMCMLLIVFDRARFGNALLQN